MSANFVAAFPPSVLSAPLSPAEVALLCARLREYPKGLGWAWGWLPREAAPLYSVNPGRAAGVACHISCFAEDYRTPPRDIVTTHRRSNMPTADWQLSQPLPADFGDPAVRIAAARGELTLRGINRALVDVQRFVLAEAGGRYGDWLTEDPQGLAEMLSGGLKAAA